MARRAKEDVSPQYERRAMKNRSPIANRRASRSSDTQATAASHGESEAPETTTKGRAGGTRDNHYNEASHPTTDKPDDRGEPSDKGHPEHDGEPGTPRTPKKCMASYLQRGEPSNYDRRAIIYRSPTDVRRALSNESSKNIWRALKYWTTERMGASLDGVDSHTKGGVP